MRFRIALGHSIFRVNRLAKLLGCVLAMLLVLSQSSSLPVFAQAALVLEDTELWTEPDLPLDKPGIFVGGICAKDIDMDGIVEIVTMGETLHESGTQRFAQLRIGRWDGASFTLLREQEWQIDDADTNGKSVYCADVNKDGQVDVLTLASKPASPDNKAELTIWNLRNGYLGYFARAFWEGQAMEVFKVAAMDVDDDGTVEIVVVGDATGYASVRVMTWNTDEQDIVLEHKENWQGGDPPQSTAAMALGLGDIDADGSTEIVTGGTTMVDDHTVIDLRVWRWSGSTMTLEAYSEWRTGDYSEAEGLALGDLDRDRFMEIVTAGRSVAPSGESSGLITVWQWDGISSLALEAYDEWRSDLGIEYTYSEFFGAYVGDVERDGVPDAIVVGAVHAAGRSVLRVYGLMQLDSAKILAAKYSEEWFPPEVSASFGYRVYSADVDDDGDMEIITVGRAFLYPGECCVGYGYGEMDVWGFPAMYAAQITDVNVVPNPVGQGSEMNFTVNVLNVGNSEIPKATVRLTIFMPNGTLAALRLRAISNFISGDERAAEIPYMLSSTAPTGGWTYGLVVFYRNVTLLDYESGGFTVEAPNISGVIVSVEDDGDPVFRTGTVTFTATFRNTGNVMWSNARITVKIYRPDGRLVDRLSQRTDVQPGDDYECRTSWQVPSRAPYGQYHYEISISYGTFRIDNTDSQNIFTVLPPP